MTRPAEESSVAVSRAMASALEHHRVGRVAEAEAIYRDVLRVAPENFDALYLLGVIELQGKRHETAVELMRRALAQNASVAYAQASLGHAYLALVRLEEAQERYQAALTLDNNSAEAHNGLGAVYQRQNQIEEATRCLRSAIELKPDFAEAHFNLGLCLKGRGQLRDAASAFRAAWVCSPSLAYAGREFVDTLGTMARSGTASVAPSAWQAMTSPNSMTSVIFCSVDDAKCAATIELYDRLFHRAPYELIPIRDAHSLSEAYNRGIASSKGDVIVLSHDDIDILDSNFAGRLHHHLRQFDVVGVMGATRMTGPGWNWSWHPHLRGWITHRSPDDLEWAPAVVDPRPIAGDVVVLDGVLIAGRRRVFEQIAFDEETFDGFHLYDIDWSYRAAQAGCRLGVAGDLRLVHASRGNFDATWAGYGELFCDKHGLEDLSPPPPPQLFETRLQSVEQVNAFFDLLVEMSQ
jgi:tetratricopeptide (TPR) repeat protein